LSSRLSVALLPGEQPPIMDRALFEAVWHKSPAQWSHRTIVSNKSDHLLMPEARAQDPESRWPKSKLQA
jgi:hypothetical protein